MRKYARAAGPQQLIGPNPSSGPGRLGPFKAYLQARGEQGITDASVLNAEIRGRGYRGSLRTLQRFLVLMRRHEQSPVPVPVPSARQITAWIMRPDDKPSDQDRLGLKDACTRCPTWQRSPTSRTASIPWSDTGQGPTWRPGSTGQPAVRSMHLLRYPVPGPHGGSEMNRPAAIVVGVGNEYRRDDALGLTVWRCRASGAPRP